MAATVRCERWAAGIIWCEMETFKLQWPMCVKPISIWQWPNVSNQYFMSLEKEGIIWWFSIFIFNVFHGSCYICIYGGPEVQNTTSGQKTQWQTWKHSNILNKHNKKLLNVFSYLLFCKSAVLRLVVFSVCCDFQKDFRFVLWNVLPNFLYSLKCCFPILSLFCVHCCV